MDQKLGDLMCILVKDNSVNQNGTLDSDRE